MRLQPAYTVCVLAGMMLPVLECSPENVGEHPSPKDMATYLHACIYVYMHACIHLLNAYSLTVSVSLSVSVSVSVSVSASVTVSVSVYHH